VTCKSVQCFSQIANNCRHHCHYNLHSFLEHRRDGCIYLWWFHVGIICYSQKQNTLKFHRFISRPSAWSSPSASQKKMCWSIFTSSSWYFASAYWGKEQHHHHHIVEEEKEDMEYDHVAEERKMMATSSWYWGFIEMLRMTSSSFSLRWGDKCNIGSPKEHDQDDECSMTPLRPRQPSQKIRMMMSIRIFASSSNLEQDVIIIFREPDRAWKISCWRKNVMMTMIRIFASSFIRSGWRHHDIRSLC